MWKRLSYLVAFPGIGFVAYATVTAPSHESEPFVSYGTYMNVRTKVRRMRCRTALWPPTHARPAAAAAVPVG